MCDQRNARVAILLDSFQAINVQHGVEIKCKLYLVELRHDFFARLLVEVDRAFNHFSLFESESLDTVWQVVSMDLTERLLLVKVYELLQLVVVIALEGVFAEPDIEDLGDSPRDRGCEPH